MIHLIPWGHYAANMANDAVRYDISDLSPVDMTGLRHLYYQRTYTRLAEQFGIMLPPKRQPVSVDELDRLRVQICNHVSELASDSPMAFNRTLWGWNFGFDFAPSGYRLHASHQQIHQQFAMIPTEVPVQSSHPQEPSDKMRAYGCGDLISDFAETYRNQTGASFFENYIRAIEGNNRTDGNRNGPTSLIVDQDENVILFVPKAQTSQWELQLMTTGKVGNVLEADAKTRHSIDQAMYRAVQILSGLGVWMITTIEYPKPLDSSDTDQRLIYSFLPKLPESPGAFSEAQLRWINGHYPEDFAEACRLQLEAKGSKI